MRGRRKPSVQGFCNKGAKTFFIFISLIFNVLFFIFEGFSVFGALLRRGPERASR